MRTLLTILFFILLISYIFRLLSPYIMRWAIRRMEKKITEQFNNAKTQKRTKSEGRVSVNQTDKKEKKVDKNVGDYIDFEEEN
ncbi:MAG: DUF4834 family protein [Prevotellaceae bacterium]|nr:DUF4834 family protein [Prevotellaceae bacterium]